MRLSTAVALPVEHDPITLAKSIATLDHLSGGRVSVGVGFGWNTDELADHNVPPGRRRTMLREYLEAHAGAVDAGGSQLRRRVRQLRAELGVAEAGAGAYPDPRRRGRHREELQVDCPQRRRVDHHAPRTSASTSRSSCCRAPGLPPAATAPRRLLQPNFKPDPDKLARWAELGVTEVLFGLPDRDADEIAGYVEHLAGKLAAAV